MHACAMELVYLIFDFTDEGAGRGSYDAMASVLPDRLPAVMAEVDAVLRWAREEFGEASAEAGEWDFELRVTDDDDAVARKTLTLTLAGSQAFCDAFAQAFDPSD